MLAKGHDRSFRKSLDEKVPRYATCGADDMAAPQPGGNSAIRLEEPLYNQNVY